ncbi:hypothetical protein ACFSSA_09390 [Luteolibacter algae]|uniref:PilZ domain-containing protein n=1 Tax=Luteolibacter algae TaxID=454151 RepID=A0ABW5DAF2_9BACT
MKHDAIIRVRFLTTSEGGRNTGIVATRYGCPLFIDDDTKQGFDCRFVVDSDVRFELGATHDIKIKFMNPSLALPKLNEGKNIYLWEGRTIAKGHIVSLNGT